VLRLEYILRRLVMAVFVLVSVSILTFFIARVIPSDPAAAWVGAHPTQDQIARARELLGLDKPLYEQYLRYMSSVLRGDLGSSLLTHQSIVFDLGTYLPATLELVLASILIAVVIGLPLGVLSGAHKGTWLDHSSRLISVAGVSMPTFWLGLIFQLLFFRWLGLLPLSGRLSTDVALFSPVQSITRFYLIDSAVTGNWTAFRDALLHLILPALPLASFAIGIVYTGSKECYRADHHPPGPEPGLLAHRRYPGRGCLRLAGAGQLSDQRRFGPRLSRHRFGDPGGNGLLCPGQPGPGSNAGNGRPQGQPAVALREKGGTMAASTAVSEARAARFRELGLMRRAFSRDWLAVVSLALLVIFIVSAILAPWLAPYPDQGRGDPKIAEKFQPPSREHLLGTDNLGRDVLSRILYGGRSSLSIGFLVVIIASLIGIPLGVAAGYYGGWIDDILMRVTDVFLAVPPLLLAIAIAAALGPSFKNAMIAISVTWWPWYARLVRAQTLSLRERHFVEAARSIGVSNTNIIRHHVLPNVLSPILVQATMDIGSAILTGAGMSFIGLGVQPPTADWGQMISIGRLYFLERPWFAGTAGLAIFSVTLAFNLLGDAVREVADPRTRRTVS
jgi:peptide/nickel transport system permease protein